MSSIDDAKRRHEEVSGGSDPMPPLGASAEDGPHDGTSGSFPALRDPDIIQASSGVNALEARRRGNHWGQIQSIHNSRNAGKKGRLLDRRRQAEVEMERTRQLAAQQPQLDGMPQLSPLEPRHTGEIPPPRPVRRAELKQPPSPNQLPADAQPCVLDLPPRVIATVGTFLSTRKLPPPIFVESVGSVLRKYGMSADLMALCIVFGSKVARTVRKVYLEHNMNYLKEIRDLAIAVRAEAQKENRSDEYKSILCGNPKALQICLEKIRVRLEAWMSENEWWKDAAKLDPAYHEDNAAKAGTPALAIFKTVMLKNIAEEERGEFLDWTIALSPIFSSGHVDLQYYTVDGDIDIHFYTLSSDSFPSDSDNKYSCVASVNGTPHSSVEQVKNLLLEEDLLDKRLQVVHSVFAEIFFNPALIIDLGLLELLKFQIEELQLDVNYQGWDGILFRYEDHEQEPLEGRSLLFHALAQPDQRIFDYLLSLKGLKANPILEQDIEGYVIRRSGSTLLHDMPRFASYPLLDEGQDLILRLRRILEREEVDVNCQLNCQHGINVETPLEGLCDMWADLGRKPRLQYDLARLYLSFGAGAIEQAKNSLEWFLQEEAEDHNAEHNDCCRELIVLLTDTQKMRDAVFAEI